MEHYIGIDVSLELSSLCVLDATGKVVREVKVASEPEARVAFLRGLDAQRPPATSHEAACPVETSVAFANAVLEAMPGCAPRYNVMHAWLWRQRGHRWILRQCGRRRMRWQNGLNRPNVAEKTQPFQGEV
jgi:hypothetical protein